jgi:hypothetical protein
MLLIYIVHCNVRRSHRKDSDIDWKFIARWQATDVESNFSAISSSDTYRLKWGVVRSVIASTHESSCVQRIAIDCKTTIEEQRNVKFVQFREYAGIIHRYFHNLIFWLLWCERIGDIACCLLLFASVSYLPNSFLVFNHKLILWLKSSE